MGIFRERRPKLSVNVSIRRWKSFVPLFLVQFLDREGLSWDV